MRRKSTSDGPAGEKRKQRAPLEQRCPQTFHYCPRATSPHTSSLIHSFLNGCRRRRHRQGGRWNPGVLNHGATSVPGPFFLFHVHLETDSHSVSEPDLELTSPLPQPPKLLGRTRAFHFLPYKPGSRCLTQAGLESVIPPAQHSI